jgi:hypothetical protein
MGPVLVYRRVLTFVLAVTGGLAAVKTGADLGSSIPNFALPDQNGATQTLATIAGPKGAMLVFFRSADW